MAGLDNLVMGQELAKLGQPWFKRKKSKPLNTKRSRRAERARLGPGSTRSLACLSLSQ